MKLLLVEDNPPDARLIREMLKEAPPGMFDLTLADRLDRALEAVRLDPPDVALMDLGLPDSSGLATLMAAQGAHPGLPIVVLTGLNDQAFAVEAVRAGAQDYLVKGRINGEVLVRTLHHAVERQRVRHQLRESEARKRAILESALDAIITIDHTGRILEFNPAAERIFGHRADDVLGREMAELIVPPARRGSHRRGMTHYLLTGEGPVLGRRIEMSALRADGTEFPIELAVTRVGMESPPVFTGFIRDVSERKRAEAARLAAEAKFRKLVEQALVGTYIIQDGRFAYVNPAMLEILGYPEQEMISRPVLDFIAEPDRALALENVRRRLAGEIESVRYQLRMLRKDGGEVHVEVHGSRSEYDGRPAILGTLLDITERKLAEERTKQLNEELERRVRERTAQLEAANKELESFSYSVSHDLRAPLRGIDGFSRVLLESYAGKLDARGQDYLQRVRAGSQRMSRLIDDLIELARWTRSTMTRTSVDLSAIAQSVVADLRQADPERKVEVVIAPELRAEGDPTLLRVALMNLLGNAWKFTGKQPEARIEVGRTTHGGVPAWFVRDNGAGFDMAYAGKLFGAFQRLHGQKEFEGTGIGLATVQRVIARHGGRIWAEGAPGRGATFYFTLPG
jgi:PAS domain S-box-containing protein